MFAAGMVRMAVFDARQAYIIRDGALTSCIACRLLAAAQHQHPRFFAIEA